MSIHSSILIPSDCGLNCSSRFIAFVVHKNVIFDAPKCEIVERQNVEHAHDKFTLYHCYMHSISKLEMCSVSKDGERASQP